MLREIANVRQVEGEPRRRWFSDERLDLVVWEDEAQGIIGFQLCYDKQRDEHALTWIAGFGFSHGQVDAGEGRPGRYKGTPIVVNEGTFNMEELAPNFLNLSEGLDKALRDFIHKKLLDYPLG